MTAKPFAVVVRDRRFQGVVQTEGNQAVGYGPATDVLRAYGIPHYLTPDGQLMIGLRGWVTVLGRQSAYDEASHTFYVDARPLPELPPDPVGAHVRPWHPVTAPIVGGPGDRRADLLTRVIQQFRVSINPRYRQDQQGQNETYCNIYLWDVTRALGVEIPHWVVGDGEPSQPGRGRELDANETVLWLRGRGRSEGWRPVRADGAAAAAQAGLPVVAAWYNPRGIGHVAIVRPGTPHPARGIPIAQAGAINADDIYLLDGFGRAPAADIEFWVHS